MASQRNGVWLPVALFLAGLVAGGGVGTVQVSSLRAEMQADHERLVRIETDVAWLKKNFEGLRQDVSRGKMAIDGAIASNDY